MTVVDRPTISGRFWAASMFPVFPNKWKCQGDLQTLRPFGLEADGGIKSVAFFAGGGSKPPVVKHLTARGGAQWNPPL
jgi:hypothetical protein